MKTVGVGPFKTKYEALSSVIHDKPVEDMEGKLKAAGKQGFDYADWNNEEQMVLHAHVEPTRFSILIVGPDNAFIPGSKRIYLTKEDAKALGEFLKGELE